MHASCENGLVSKSLDVEKLVGDKEVTLDELLEVFKIREQGEFDYSELERAVIDHDVDLELRRRILQLGALGLLYSKNTIPEYGYERARKFIAEFNESGLGTELSSLEIDEIMGRDYKRNKVACDDLTSGKMEDVISHKRNLGRSFKRILNRK